MAASNILGYKKIFGFVLPDWVNEKLIKNTLIGVFIVVTMFLLLVFLVWPNFDIIRAREQELAKNRSSLETLLDSKAGLDRLRVDLTAEEQRRILASIPEDYSPESAIFMLRRISADTGASIVSYSLPSGVLLDSADDPAKSASADMVTFTSFPIRITLAAPVEALLRFISTVESSLPYGVVSDLNLQQVTKLTQTTTDDKVVQLALEIRFFQTFLNKVNLTQLEALSAEDIQLAKQLGQFNLLTIPNVNVVSETLPEASGTGSLFGY